MLRLFTLGRLDLTRGDGRAIESVPVQEKRLAVLAYLAVAGPSRRDTVIGLFWPELSQAEARRALRQALYHLRNALGDGVVESHGEELLLAPARLWCDAAELAAPADDSTALGLYQGDFLTGLFVTETATALEDWLAATRSRLRARATSAAGSLADREAAAGALVPAVTFARRAVDLAPQDETHVRRLMTLLDRLGDRAGALAVHGELTRRLEHDLGTTPGAATEALARAIRIGPSGQVTTRVDSAEGPGSMVSRPARHLSSRSRIWISGILVAGVGAGLVIAWSILDQDPTLFDRGRMAPGNRILIADFRNLTQDTLLGPALTELVRVDLSQSPVLHVLSRAEIRDARARMHAQTSPIADSLASEMAVREGAKVVVGGEIAALGTALSLTAEILAPQTGEVLAAFTETAADPSQVIHAADRLTRAIRRSIGEPLRSLRHRRPLERVTTPSLAALRAYTAAQRLLEVGQDRPAQAMLLRQAVTADSGFASAWSALANLSYAIGEFQAGRAAIQNAYRHLDRLSDWERYNVEANYHYYVTDDPSLVLTAYRALLDRDSTDFRIRHNLALTYQGLRDYQQQEVAELAALSASDSAFTIIWIGLLEARIDRGHLTDARSTLAAARKRFPDDPYLSWIEGYIAANEGDYHTVERVGRALAETPGHQVEGNRVLGALAALQGRFEAAERHRRFALQANEADGLTASVIEDLSALAGIVRIRDGLPTAQARFAAEISRRGIDRLPLAERPFEALIAGYLLLDLSEPARLQLEAAEASGVRIARVLRSRLTAAIAADRGRPAEAIVELHQALRADDCPICILPRLGDAYRSAGFPDSALAVYRAYFATPSRHRLWWDALYYIPTSIGLAALYRARGDRVAADSINRGLLELWRRADPPARAAIQR